MSKQKLTKQKNIDTQKQSQINKQVINQKK